MSAVRHFLVLAFAFAAACSSEPAEPTPPTILDDTLPQTELLIVAPDDYAATLQPLVDWKCQRGVPTRLVMLSAALDAGTGPDDAAKLRDYIKSEFEKGSLRHVLLGGDVEVLPARWVDIEYDNELADTMEYARAATDLYYGDLDGDWDPDGDGVYGQYEDPADLLPDISVGRLPVATAQEATEFVAKLLQYEKTPKGDYEDRVLLGSAYAGAGVYATVAMELYVHRELPADIPVTMLYEDADQRDGALMLSRESMTDGFNQGHNVAFMMGHGSEDSMGPLSCSDIQALTNGERPSIFITCECSGGRFDYEQGDSSGEEFVKGATGGLAYIGSTDLGIGFPSMSLLMRDITRCVFEDRLESRELGACLHAARRSFPQSESMHAFAHPDRWAQIVTVLLGDPSLLVWTNRPQTVDLSVARRGCDVADVTVTTLEGDPVQDAVVTAYVPGASLRVARTNPSGKATLASDDCSLSEATITVSGRNVRPAWSDDR